MPGNEEVRQNEPSAEVPQLMPEAGESWNEEPEAEAPQSMPEAEEPRQEESGAEAPRHVHEVGELKQDEPEAEASQPMPEAGEPQQDEPGEEEPQQAAPLAEEEAQSHEPEQAAEAPFLRSKRKMQAGQISPNKWEQLNRIYPKIQPFGDVREYLSIAPCDFVILSEHYQEMVQNSFLLHGYYNYGHLILTKIKEGIDDNYYLGVPGVYYEREKQAALLFGFEGFEGDGDAVQDGSFGYYMKRVEI